MVCILSLHWCLIFKAQASKFHVEISASGFQSLVIFIPHLLFLRLSPPFVFLSDDVNANPNKRQRQPALLGDHPPEYGKALTPLKKMH